MSRLLAGVLAAFVASRGDASGLPSLEERVGGVLRLWERPRGEFNRLVRLSSPEIPPLQQLLGSAEGSERRRAISILLALNCALPAGHRQMRDLQLYRCQGAAYPAFHSWAISRSGDVYVLAFAKPADRASAIESLVAADRREQGQPIERVAEKEALAEVIAYLQAGGFD